MLRDVMMRGQERELTLQTLVAMQALLNKNKKVLLLGKKTETIYDKVNFISLISHPNLSNRCFFLFFEIFLGPDERLTALLNCSD
jgi:hypothetical protein